jgi:hypothetical protein
LILTITKYLVDLNLERSSRVLIIREMEEEKNKRAKTARIWPEYCQAGPVGMPRILTKKRVL